MTWVTLGSSPLARGLRPLRRGQVAHPRIIPARAGFTWARVRAVSGCRDHPRSRGVYFLNSQSASANAGSSPLARGLRAVAASPPGRVRIIPARAGFTGRRASGRPSGRDHPRSRGVYRAVAAAAQERVGSSPLARGLPAIWRECTEHSRIIPARAGFTERQGADPRPRRDHPRSRGVYAAARAAAAPRRGSSPLARGLRLGAPHRGGRTRIIPARAGFTGLGGIPGGESRDHPRSRGVYDEVVGPDEVVAGSSPLARGLLDHGVHTPVCVGIIPARAGFTVGPLGGNAGQGDHPRSRGVYTARSSSTPSPSGSSPLARGLRGDRRPRCPRTRIIPARAGFTDQGAQAGPVAGDHPRSRGVYRPIERPGIGALGSSPLARGLRRDRPPRRLRPGIIPARAGFTPRPGRQAAGAPDHPRSRGVYAPGRGVRGGQDGSSPLARGLPPVTRMVTKPCRIIPARAGFTVRALTRLFRGVDHPRSRGVYVVG